MQNKITYYLAIATTSAFGMFGVVGALYAEMTKEIWEQNTRVAVLDFVVILIMASFMLHHFGLARTVMKKDEKECASKETEVTKHKRTEL